ncbi:MAG: glutamate synthase [Lentisphaerae bacterium GWF2_44_16]|nr:MAG: glutamate synthase [Lentisphaerae bacterium GWF2_44_16]
MGNPKGFMEVQRKEAGYRPVEQRVKDYAEVEKRLSESEIKEQASRCMDCGIPFCHGAGCPLNNLAPEWNDLVYSGHWKEALDILCSTNNFPEFTGRVCPAPCESACTVGINGDPVAIRQIETAIIEKGFQEGYFRPRPPAKKTGFKVAVIGSGPAGLATADILNKCGHSVTVFEKDIYAGGLLRYGIPDFKLDKGIVQRRINLMAEEGITFETSVNAGIDISAKFLMKRFDVICLTGGSKEPRDIKAPGRELDGIHFAMDFLWQQNCRVSGEPLNGKELTAAGKNVVVIGGGDTGSDCVGTSRRQDALSITQIEIMPKPPEGRHESTPWPLFPYMLKTSSSHKEGCERMWNILTKSFEGKDGKVSKINAVKVEWETDKNGRPVKMKEIPGSEFTLKAELVLLAMGFTGPEKEGLLSQFNVEFDGRGNVKVDEKSMSSRQGVFATGDIVSGPSLVVRAIAAGRKLAESVDEYLQKK